MITPPLPYWSYFQSMDLLLHALFPAAQMGNGTNCMFLGYLLSIYPARKTDNLFTIAMP